jgi:hypothetical protein
VVEHLSDASALEVELPSVQFVDAGRR